MSKEAEGLREAFQQVIEEARQVPQMPNNHQTITVHHADPPKPEPWQAWVCVTACLVMLSVFIAGGVIGTMWLSREFTKADNERNDLSEETMRMQSLLSAIYVRAPQLKPDDWEKQQAEWDQKRKERRRHAQ